MFRDKPYRYMLSGDPELDLETEEVLVFSRAERRQYIFSLLSRIHALMEDEPTSVTLRMNVSKATFLEALERLWNEPANPARNRFLKTADDGKRNVLMPKTPAHSEHMVLAEHAMWQMVTKCGDLPNDIRTAVSDVKGRPQLFAKKSSLLGRLDSLLNAKNTNKQNYRAGHEWALPMIYSYVQTQYNLRSAFPPFHAKFFAELFLPLNKACLVVDPCAGWSGRLIGTMFVNRGTPINYRGVDPNPEMRHAYSKAQGWSVFDVMRRMYELGVSEKVVEHTKSVESEDWSHIDPGYWLRQTAIRARRARVDQGCFEQWIHTDAARPLFNSVDLVMTSPPYFNAEVYHADGNQSANNYPTYRKWREQFYRPLVQGACDLLRPGGVFVLNVANVEAAPTLEQDAHRIADACGFIHETEFRLAMPITPGTRRRTSGTTTKRLLHTLTLKGKPYKFEPCFVFRKPSTCG